MSSNEQRSRRTPNLDRRALLLGGSVVVGAAAVGLLGGCDRPQQRPPERPKSHRLFGISVTGAEPSSIEIAIPVGTALDRRPQVINFFMAWQWQPPFPVQTVAAIRQAGATPEITWEPWNPDGGAVQPAYELALLNAYDSYVDAFAHGCAEYGDDVVLRFAHEMNSHWYPWSASVNSGSPAAYVAAYRRLHQRCTQAGAKNMRWVWCPNVLYNQRPDLIEASYPGDDVVDLIAVDGYNRGGQSPTQLFGETLQLLDRIAPTKPLWINEVGTINTPDKPQWITDLFTLLNTTRVEGLLWFEIDSSEADWRLLSTPESTAAARSALEKW